MAHPQHQIWEIYVTTIRHWDYQTETDSDGLHVVYGYWNDEGWWHVTNWMVPPCITSA